MSFPFQVGPLDPARLGQGPTAYTPVLTASSTNPNLGANSVARGAWVRVGPNMVAGWARFVWGGTGRNPGSGTYMISLPPGFPADTGVMDVSTTPGYGFLLGSGYVRDNGTGSNNQLVTPQLETETVFRLVRHATSTAVSESNTIVWDVNDTISASFLYVIAES